MSGQPPQALLGPNRSGPGHGTAQSGNASREGVEKHRPGRKPRSSHEEENELETEGHTDHKGEGRERDWYSVRSLRGLAGRAGQRSGGPVPSPEDVEADVALEVNVGVINHRLTLHLGGVMRVTLAHLAPGEERSGG